MQEIIKNSGEDVFQCKFLMEDGSRLSAPVGIGYLPEQSKIFFYPAKARLMINNGVTDLTSFLRDWLVFIKLINKEPVDTNEIAACNRVNAYYMDFKKYYFGDAEFNSNYCPPFSKKWNNVAWNVMKSKPEFYNYIKEIFNFDSNNVSTL